MSFLVPILSDSFDTLSQLGADFRREAREERGVHLIDPLVKPPRNSFNQQSADLVESGVQDFNEFRLGQNASQPSRYIESAYNFLDRFEQFHGGGLERDFDDDDFLNNDVIDGVKLANMKREPQRGSDEIFDEYGRKTVDFVGLAQSGIKALEEERNLYLTATEKHAQALAAAQEHSEGGSSAFGPTFEEQERADIMQRAAKIQKDKQFRAAKEKVRPQKSSKPRTSQPRPSARQNNIASQPERSFAGVPKHSVRPGPSPGVRPSITAGPSPQKKKRRPKLKSEL